MTELLKIEDVHLRSSRIPKIFWDIKKEKLPFPLYDEENFLPKEMYQFPSEYISDKNQLFLGGPSNTGKTLVACQFAKHFIKRFLKVIFIRANEISDSWQKSFNDLDGINIEEGIRKWDLVILDDLGSESRSERTEVLINRLLKTRQEEGLASIVTSCILPEQFKSNYNDNLRNTMNKFEVVILKKENSNEKQAEIETKQERKKRTSKT